MGILRARKTWVRDPSHASDRWRSTRLTPQERANARAVMKRLRPMHGTWARYAIVLGVSYETLKAAKTKRRGPGIALVLRVARAAGLSVEDIIGGRVEPSPCPWCGR